MKAHSARAKTRRFPVKAPRVLGLVVASIALAAAVFLFILPTRTYLAQRRSLSAAETRLRVFRDQNTKLAASATRLQTDAEIERLARENYGLVKPGEKAYLVVPPPAAANPTPNSAGPSKASAAKGAHPGLLPRLWHDIQFWS